jgi:hypothetical protein
MTQTTAWRPGTPVRLREFRIAEAALRRQNTVRMSETEFGGLTSGTEAY